MVDVLQNGQTDHEAISSLQQEEDEKGIIPVYYEPNNQDSEDLRLVRADSRAVAQALPYLYGLFKAAVEAPRLEGTLLQWQSGPGGFLK